MYTLFLAKLGNGLSLSMKGKKLKREVLKPMHYAARAMGGVTLRQKKEKN